MIKTKLEIIKYLEQQKDDEIFDISKKQDKTIRSLAQNRYYWWYVVDTICKWSWDTPISTHYGIKKTIWVETTTDLSTDEFKFIIDLIRDLFLTKYNLNIPLPRDIKEEESLFESLLF